MLRQDIASRLPRLPVCIVLPLLRGGTALVHEGHRFGSWAHVAVAANDAKAAEDATGQMNALILFKADMGAFQRMYSFLSQIFDYGNTDIEKRFIFYRRLSPLLEFGRERDGIDLSKVLLTHHSLKDQGTRQLPFGDGEPPKLTPISEAGSGSVQEKEKARLAEIIAKVNDLFEGDLTDYDQLVYVNNVIKGKLLECQELVVQASNRSRKFRLCGRTSKTNVAPGLNSMPGPPC
jgi:type I restriction enzyme R subunit